jgi:hypothetical protein
MMGDRAHPCNTRAIRKATIHTKRFEPECLRHTVQAPLAQGSALPIAARGATIGAAATIAPFGGRSLCC